MSAAKSLLGAQRTRGGKKSVPKSTAAAKTGVRSANNVRELYQWIRAAILSGKIAVDEPISQAKLAAGLGVSRTPLREALRMLQAEGLLVGELNQRMRVASPTAEDLDSLYGSRIVLETFGLALTIPRLTRGEIQQIQQTLKHMNAHNWIGDRAGWEVQHNAFHRQLLMHVGTLLGSVLADTISNFQLRAERYRRLYVSTDPDASAIAANDHARITEAVAERDTDAAVQALAEHLSRTALRLVARRAQNFEAKAVNNALALVRHANAAAMDYLQIAAHAELLPTAEQLGSLPLKP